MHLVVHDPVHALVDVICVRGRPRNAVAAEDKVPRALGELLQDVLGEWVGVLLVDVKNSWPLESKGAPLLHLRHVLGPRAESKERSHCGQATTQ
eukprot:scaffold72640_cov74-Phaeocystis_antarctica.AAC.1